MIVLDTNVVSELFRPAPDANVLAWVGRHSATALFTTAVTEAEILYGVALLPRGKRRDRLQEAISAVFRVDFRDRVLPFDRGAAVAFARIASERRAGRRPISQLDAQIAAIVSSREGSLATRSVGDFEGVGIKVVNPWEAAT